ncbi:flavin reductase family protein [Phaeacidiphilus oryzae]|uniref:flavin reductase family protein n=1 Tax=Phaeacidiphilus oryzae TaxID=348818 RepID=UPI00056730DF|nr:flavin reductase family protein [Phaeacidiphilus oryzae]
MGHQAMAIAAVRHLGVPRGAGAEPSPGPVVAASAPPPSPDAGGPGADELRSVLGHFATGVTVIAARTRDGEPVGFACQSFGSLSLDPPLVSFSVARTSSSWPRIARSGAFCANILAADQQELCRSFAVSSSTGADKFAGVEWEPTQATGSPRLAGALAWVDCTIQAVHVGGDHLIVLGRVRDLLARQDADASGPLVFYRGRFELG